MAGAADGLVQRWNVLYDWLVGPNYEDSRVADWPLIGWQAPLIISLVYMLGIPLGMALMKNREPFKVRTFAVFHNLVLFSLSLYMAVECVRWSHANFGWGVKGFALYCNQNDPLSMDGGRSFSPSGYALARILYIHYISKAYEFVDTLIMVLKKNNRQITFLHVYHHASTFFPVWWAVMKYGPGGDAWFCCFLNSSIHVLMYGYYLAATCGLKLTLIKPLITMSQMIQFICFIVQGSTMIYRNCYTPRLSAVMLVFQCIIFFILFTNFFIRTYAFKKKRSTKKLE